MRRHVWVAAGAAVATLAAVLMPASIAPAVLDSAVLGSAVVDGSGATASAATPAVRADKAPDIVVILTDDQGLGLMGAMPRTQSLIGDRGITFTNAHSATPTCCPARATLLTGHLAGKTGVWTNWPPEGGWEAFKGNGMEEQTFVRELDEAGYTTALVGKYLNGYSDPKARERLTGDEDYIPEGWDIWHAFSTPPSDPKGDHQAYYDYWLMNRESPSAAVEYTYQGKDPASYSTDYLGKQVIDIIKGTPRSEPLFVLYTPYSPHAPFDAAPRHKAARVPEVTVDGYNDVRGKPPWVAQRKKLPPAAGAKLAKKQQRTLLATDEVVEGIVTALRREGRLDNTLLIFASDNGLALGQFRLLDTKNYPYFTGVPFMLRWDAGLASQPQLRGKKDSRIVSLSDVAATALTAAGLPSASDQSLNLMDPLATRPELTVAAWRNRGAGSPMPAYCGTRTTRWLYIRYATGFEELYHLVRDPGMVTNLAKDQSHGRTLRDLRERTRTSCVPAPPGFRW